MSAALPIKVPDIGDFKDVPIIEVLVKPGDRVEKETSLITLESDKATMEVPSPTAGVVKEVKVKLGDKVSEGSVILLLEEISPHPSSAKEEIAKKPELSPIEKPDNTQVAPQPYSVPGGASPISPTANVAVDQHAFLKAHASPAIRKFARELGVDLAKVKGTGPKERIFKEDVQNFVKQILSGTPSVAGLSKEVESSGLNLLPWPKIDFAKFGPVEVKPLARIKKISGANLARNWVMIPHVTQHDEGDITELEAFRVQLNRENEKTGIKLTMLSFLIKICVAGLQKFPEFNASLDGENIVLKKYCHIGFAADTPNGLMVPVIRDADQKGVLQVAKETAALALKAREGKLSPTDMQGGCFSISSLGGIGGTMFTPIINAPELAILGVSKAQTKRYWDGKQFVPRLILPLSLSYDHRVIDGASAARFTSYLSQLLADFRRAVL